MKLDLPIAQRIKTGDGSLLSIEVPAALRYDYRELVRKGQPADRYHVVVETPKRKRSTGPWSQNHHFNGHCMQISHETGQDFDTVKLYVKRQAIARGLRLKTKPTGEPIFSLTDGNPVPISEADMTVEECGWCIEESHILAAELGIILREE